MEQNAGINICDQIYEKGLILASDFELSRGIILHVVKLMTQNLHSHKINDRESIVQNFKTVV